MARAAVTSAAWPAWRERSAWAEDGAVVRAAEADDVADLVGREALAGRCALCERDTQFVLGDSAAPLREGLLCAHCRCNARQRAAAMVLLDALLEPARTRVYVTEQASPFYVALRRRIGRLDGSEFGQSTARHLRLSAWLWRQGVHAWVRREDVTALRIADGSLAAVVSLDVLEHVPDYRAALGEFARVLQPGGTLVLTVPFYDDVDANAAVAWLAPGGAIVTLGAPEFHGDPVSGGARCFHHFGWDLLQAIRAAGFDDAQACRVASAGEGLPQGQWVLRARR